MKAVSLKERWHQIKCIDWADIFFYTMITLLVLVVPIGCVSIALMDGATSREASRAYYAQTAQDRGFVDDCDMYLKDKKGSWHQRKFERNASILEMKQCLARLDNE